MRNIKLRRLLALCLAFWVLFTAPKEAFAVPIQNLNGLTTASQTFQSDSNVTITSLNNVHSIGWLNFLPISRGGTGVGSFTTGSIPFIWNGVFSEDNSNLFWDNVNKRLGIGTSSPTSRLSINGNTSILGNLNVTGGITGNVTAANLVPYTGATGNVDLGAYNLTATRLTSTTDATINSITVGLGGGSNPSNTALGFHALFNNIDIDTRSVAIGANALFSNTARSNTAVGWGSISNSENHGEQNTAVGSSTLFNNTTGSYNAAYGFQALEQNTTGIRNVAIGMSALESNNTGSNNVALGYRSLADTTTGGSNVAIGDLSGAFLTEAAGGNVVIGPAAAIHQADGSTALTNANGSIYIGNIVQGYDNNDFNSIVIGSAAIGAGANKTVIGNSNMTDVYFGSADANSNIHAKKMFLGSSSTPGCIVMGDSDGIGVTYLTVNDGVLTASSTQPSACQ